MLKRLNNYAFIDANNLNLGVKSLGWTLDYDRFRIYLEEKYSVKVIYLFFGFIKENEALYKSLQKKGYILKFKPVIIDKFGNYKGNIDADLVLQVMLDYLKFDKAVIVSSDGDFYSIVNLLYEDGKLEKVISTRKKTCSILLKRSAREKIVFIDNLSNKLSYKEKHRLRTEP